MAWITPKTNWGAGNGPTSGDLNRWEENVRVLEKTTNDLPKTSGTVPNYLVSIDDFIGLTKGRKVTIELHEGTKLAATLNINGLGAKSIIKAGGGNPNLKEAAYTFVYTGLNFQLSGEGGEGTAQPNMVLDGETFTNDDDVYVGTMPNVGTVNKTFTQQGEQLTIQKGYHDGNGVVKVKIEAEAVSTFTDDNLWLMGGGTSNLVGEPTTDFGKFKTKVGGNITVRVDAMQYTSGASGTFTIYFYKNGVLLSTKYLSTDTTSAGTVTADLSVLENDIIELKARYSGSASSASVNRYYVNYSLNGILPPEKL